jgi:hypothetical protein
MNINNKHETVSEDPESRQNGIRDDYGIVVCSGEKKVSGQSYRKYESEVSFYSIYKLFIK